MCEHLTVVLFLSVFVVCGAVLIVYGLYNGHKQTVERIKNGTEVDYIKQCQQLQD